MADLKELLPWAAMLAGALASYYGARNAMTERLAKLEAKHEAITEAHAEDIKELRLAVSDTRSRLDRLIERR